MDKDNSFITAEWYLEDLKTKFQKIRPEDYYLSYSGGKDSHFLYWFIKEYAKIEGIVIVGFNTYMEHPEILKRIKDNSDVIRTPKLKPHEIKMKYGSPTFGKWADEMIERYQKGNRTKNTVEAITGENRTVYKISKKAKDILLSGDLHKVSNKCCKILKKDVAREYEKQTGKKAILGVRREESNIRNQQYQSCFTKDRIFTPIHDLSDDILEKIIKLYDIEVPEIYKHISRTGCMGCPYGRYSGNLEKELKLMEPARLNYINDLFGESYKVIGIEQDHYQTRIEIEE